MTLHAEWTDEELPELQAFINRALNTADPAYTPAWAWKLDAAVVAKMNDIKREKQCATLIAAGGDPAIIDQQLGPKEFISDK